VGTRSSSDPLQLGKVGTTKSIAALEAIARMDQDLKVVAEQVIAAIQARQKP